MWCETDLSLPDMVSEIERKTRDAGVPCDEAVVPSVGVRYPVLGFKWRKRFSRCVVSVGLDVNLLLGDTLYGCGPRVLCFRWTYFESTIYGVFLLLLREKMPHALHVTP